MAGTWSYTESTNKLLVIAGTSGAPATFSDGVTADRAGFAELKAATAINADPTSFSLTYQPRPVEDLAIRLRITASADKVGATCDIDGDDWQGNHQDDDAIDISNANSVPVVTTSYWSAIDASGITIDGIDDGTTIKIEQEYWGVIWDYGNGTYKIDCVFWIGDNNNATYFADTDKRIILDVDNWATGNNYRALPVYRYATLELGGLINATDKTTQRGCSIYVISDTYYGQFVYTFPGSVTYLYSASVASSSTTKDVSIITGVGSGPNRVWNCSFFERTFLNSAPETDVYNMSVVKSTAVIRAPQATTTVERIGGNTVTYAVWFQGFASTARDVWCRDFTKSVRLASLDADEHCYIIDGDFGTDSWTMSWSSALSNLYRQYTVNFCVAGPLGGLLEGVVVDCYDKDGNAAWAVGSIATDANGDIAEQTVTRGTYDSGNGDTLQESSPHKFIFTMPGYETLVIDNVTITDPIVSHVELQSLRARAFGRSHRIHTPQFA